MHQRATDADASLLTPAGSVAPQGGVQPAAPTTSSNGHTDQPTANLPFRGPYERFYKRHSRIDSRIPEISTGMVLGRGN